MKAQFIKDYPSLIEKVDRLIRSEHNQKTVKISYHSQTAKLDYDSLKKKFYVWGTEPYTPSQSDVK
jgi:hypothetical protein